MARRRLTRRALSLVVIALAITAAGLAVQTRLNLSRTERAYPPSGTFVDVEGVRLHYAAAGAGPAVVLLHGNPGSTRDYDALQPALAGRYRTIALDRPGHGYSARPSEMTPQQQSATLHAFLAKLGVQRPVIVGHSWGGGLALIHALEYPDDVGAVVTLAPRAQVQPVRESWLYRAVRTPFLGPALAWTLLGPLGQKSVGQGLASAYAPSPVPADALERAQALWLRPGQAQSAVWDTWHLQQALSIATGRYPQLAPPLTIVTGAHDQLLPESQALHDAVPGSQLVLLKDAGHMALRTHVPAVVDVIDRLGAWWRVHEGGVGPLALGQFTSPVSGWPSGSRPQPTSIDIEGQATPAVELTPPGASVTGGVIAELRQVGTATDARQVWRIRIADPAVRTAGGVGIGSTVEQLRSAHQVDWVGTGEGRTYLRVNTLNASFGIESDAAVSGVRDAASVPGQLRIVSIIVTR